MPAIHKDNVIAREQAETKQHMTTNVLSQTLWTRQLSFIILQFCSPFIQISRRLFRRTDAVCNLYDSESAARNAMAAEEIFIDCNSVVRVVFRFGFANTTLNKEIDFLRDLPPLTDVILCIVCCMCHCYAYSVLPLGVTVIHCATVCMWILTSTFASKWSLSPQSEF